MSGRQVTLIRKLCFQSFTDAEVAEDDVEDVLDVDPAGQPAERGGRNPQFLGDELLAALLAFGAFSQRPVQGR